MNRINLIGRTGIHKIFRFFNSGTGHVLMFHRVWNEDNTVFNKFLQVTPGYLEDLIQYFIVNKTDIITLDECYRRITSKDKLKKFVVFTFDDGYADNMTHALPIFEKYQVPFTIFLTTGYPDYTIVLWWYLLEQMVLKNNIIKFQENRTPFSYITKTPHEKREAFSKIRKLIIEGNQENLLSRLKEIFTTEHDLYGLTKKMALSWEQVIELSKHPLVTIGAHTVNHYALSMLTEDQVRTEIMESVSKIENKTGKSVSYLAYPFGALREANDREFKIAESSNIKMAFTTERGNISRHHIHQLHSLPRIGMYEDWSMSYYDLYFSGLTPFIDRFRLHNTKISD